MKFYSAPTIISRMRDNRYVLTIFEGQSAWTPQGEVHGPARIEYTKMGDWIHAVASKT